MTRPTLQDTLIALFDLGRLDRPATADSLAEVLGASALRVAETLLELERRGLVDAGRCRLTMIGLAVAASVTTETRTARAEDAAHPRAQDADPTPDAGERPTPSTFPRAA